MKAAGFFFAIFFSMLAVFLLATGEVKRWFVKEPKASIVLGGITSRETPASPSKNMLEFDFYDVERAELVFRIRAEFSQDEFQVDTPIEQISKLTLRNGVIEVPMQASSQGTGEEAVKPAGEEATKESNSPKKLLLEFKSAVYHRDAKPPSPRAAQGETGAETKSGLEVLLRNGKGTTDDGTEFFFEELAFGEKGPNTFFLRSEKPVSIRNPGFGVKSPAGLEGTLKERGQQEFLLLPPVSAILDVASQGAILSNPPTDADPTKSSALQKGERIAVTCQEPLSIIYEERDRDANTRKPAKTLIGFHKDVVLYPIDASATLESLPGAKGSRFECQELEVELEGSSGKPLPRHAIATCPGGRVKAYLQKKSGGESYVVDGERLEWTREEKTDATPPGLSSSEAILYGNPTIRGRGMVFHSDRATFRPVENRLVLETVQGTLEHLAADEKEGHKARKQTESRFGNPPSDPWDGNPGALTSGLGPEPPGREAHGKGEDAPRAKIPQLWDMSADQVEFFFTGPEHEDGGAAAERGFSKFVARSKEPDGVQIKNHADMPFLATGDLLTYFDAEKKATLEGTKDVKPRFTQGTNWIESQRVQFFQEENEIWFEEAVRAKLEDLKALGRLSGAKEESPGGEVAANPSIPGEVGPVQASKDKDVPAIDSTPLELEANFLAVRFESDKKSVQDVVARGLPGLPVRVTTLSTPWYRFTGPELYWDKERDVAQLFTTSAEKNGAPRTAADAKELAHVELDGGDLAAERILFYHKTWQAHLLDRVTLRAFDKNAKVSAPVLEVSTGKAEIEFFEKLQRDDTKREGQLRNLSFIKSFHAFRSPDHLIDVRGSMFTGRAEECTWDSAIRELRFFGSGQQEIELLHKDLHGPTTAREIIYDEAKNSVILRGSVQGTLLQFEVATVADRTNFSSPTPPPAPEPSPIRAEPSSADLSGATVKATEVTKKPLEWQFETSLLEIQLRQQAGASGAFEFESLRARDKVHLRSEDLGVQLRGDDLSYDHATRKVHVFSPDGRPQTLVYGGTKATPTQDAGAATSHPPEKKEDAAADRIHKVVAQEIWLLLYENVYAVPERGDRSRWLLAQFEKDVIATFWLPQGPGPKPKLEALGDALKLVAEKLTLYVDPQQSASGGSEESARKVVPWAAATGKVAFSSGTLQATAERAIYEESESRISLFGSPARLYKNSEPVLAEPEILIFHEGGHLGAKYRKGDGKSPRLPILGSQ